MRRQGGQYIDPNQMMQQQQQQQQYNNYAVAGNAAYPGPAAADPMRPGDAYSYVASSRPSDGYTYVDPSSYPTTGYVDGQAQKLAPKSQTPPNTNNNNIKPQPAYEDNNNIINIQTIEGLEQKFLQDLTKLSKEHNDAEDAEISRHRDRLIEISSQYQEKIAAIRAHHLKQREEFLRKEAQSRYNQSLQGRPHPNYPPGFPVEAQHRTPNYPAGHGAELAQQQTGGYPPAGGYGAEVAQQQAAVGYPPAGGYGAEVAQQQTGGYPPAGGYGAEVAQQQAAVGYPPAGGYGAEVAQQQAAVGYNGGEVQQRPPYPGPAGAYGYHGGRGYNNAGGRQF